MKLIDFLNRHGIPYQNLALYKEAFTHASYVNERREMINDYERLEFMGDAVLQLYVSDFLFKKFPNESEGQLTTHRAKLVREESLARFARELGIGEVLFLGVGEEKNGGRDRESVLANVYESFIGAVYLDVGSKYARKILEETIYKHANDLDYEDITDYKTKLQELIQADTRKTVNYELLNTSGPSNAPEFEIAAMMDDMCLGVGKGTSKKRAEQKAAQDALAKLAKTDFKAKNEV
ncbi:ribonuclease III [Beduini massiliensis]|uniref:ribonuclease III n=1 Tax=Beduini massiliensis TaxID=1585974 RepID=UPI00059A9598|nr:ribonuclease III [Beduini massiliensis]